MLVTLIKRLLTYLYRARGVSRFTNSVDDHGIKDHSHSAWRLARSAVKFASLQTPNRGDHLAEGFIGHYIFLIRCAWARTNVPKVVGPRPTIVTLRAFKWTRNTMSIHLYKLLLNHTITSPWFDTCRYTCSVIKPWPNTYLSSSCRWVQNSLTDDKLIKHRIREGV